MEEMLGEAIAFACLIMGKIGFILDELCSLTPSLARSRELQRAQGKVGGRARRPREGGGRGARVTLAILRFLGLLPGALTFSWTSWNSLKLTKEKPRHLEAF